MTKKTQTTLLIAAAAGVAIYFITRPKLASTTIPSGYLPPAYVPPGYNSYPQTGTTAGAITAAASGISSLINAISNAAGKSSAPPVPAGYTPPQGLYI